MNHLPSKIKANAPPPAPRSFETSSHLTTVTIQPFDPDADEDSLQPQSLPGSSTLNPLKRKASSTIDLLPASSRRSMKKERNEKERLKLEKGKAKDSERRRKLKGKASGNGSHKMLSEKDIIKLLEPEINTESLKPAPPSTSSSSKRIIPTSSSSKLSSSSASDPNSKSSSSSSSGAKAKKEKAFRYETKLERAKQRAHNADQRAKRKEKRLQEEEG